MPQENIFVSFTILLAAALVGGMVAHRLRQPVILGYLVVGALIGPFALKVISDSSVVESAATIGVSLLMFTLGLEISISQLRQVGKVGLWGGFAQILLTALLGTFAGRLVFGWPLSEAIIFGLVISLSSTMVCLKILMDRGELDSIHGRIMIAILIVQDISVVAMMLVTPLLAGGTDNLLLTLATSAGKALLVIGLTIATGLWFLPWLMGRVAGIRSRELFLLIVLVLSLGTALGTQILGLSTVFGAFLIGLVLRETRFAHEALAEVTPLRDVFAALFFVSLGMLLDFRFVMDQWPMILTAVALIIAIKFLVVSGITWSFGYKGVVAVIAGVGLFQIGEFGFILAQGGVTAGIVSRSTYSLLVSSAIITMLLTPLSMSMVSLLYKDKIRKPLTRLPTNSKMKKTVDEPLSFGEQVIIAGFGRVGQNIAHGLAHAGVSYSVIEIDPEVVFKLNCNGTNCIYGDASNSHVLSNASLDLAKVLVVTFPDPLAVLSTVKAALAHNPKLKIVARVHREKEAVELRKLGVKELISPEFEASLEFIRRVLSSADWSEADTNRLMLNIKTSGKLPRFIRGDNV
ncbi:MAG: sodium:proton exchanger [Dehalococcoidia bacterium]|nr:MAG: sodium:proton exchanger [Dehalococcoidia bacterium]